jgi:peptidoglycan/LPS O-acetylase OafA/YrhL
MVYTGTISYGLYVLHKIPFDIAKALRLERHPLLVMALVLIACYAAAALSSSVLERPFLRSKPFFESVPVPLTRTSSQLFAG